MYQILLLMHVTVGLLDIVRNCTYIGMADDVFALLQYKTQLYLANVVNLR
jgi:DNA mismatch repair protein MLH1